MTTPHFLVGKFEEHQRSQARRSREAEHINTNPNPNSNPNINPNPNPNRNPNPNSNPNPNPNSNPRKRRLAKDPEFLRESLISYEANTSARRLFNPDTDNPSNTNRGNKAQDFTATRPIYDQRIIHHAFRTRPAFPSPGEKDDIGQQQKINQNHDHLEPAPPTEVLLQPVTRPISHDQLFLEVKGIYAGLLIVESKCIEVDSKQSHAARQRDPSSPPTKLSDEQWQALISLHKTLLHEHHDFCLASQHPSANLALSKLPEHYSMPARMWRHGIHSFLEVLRHRLPESLDHMLAFIYIAYSMVALLYETVPSFESTWIECLGDLGRYRMAIEEDMRDREVWSGVARFWYSKGADKDPNQGRLYHHLAILARHSSVQQLSLYSKALTCVTPFESARSSIMTLFSPIVNGKDTPYLRSIPFETMFIKVHGMLFSGTGLENYESSLSRMTELLDTHITRSAAKFKEHGISAAIANMSALFEYGGGMRQSGQSGARKSILQLCFKSLREAESRAIKEAVESIKPDGSNMETRAPSDVESSLQFIGRAMKLAFDTFTVCLQQNSDKNVLPLIGVYFMFIWDLGRIEDVEGVKSLISKGAPWSEMCTFLNRLVRAESVTARVRAREFPRPKEQNGRPLPEDFLMRGQWYFPDNRFSGTMIDEEERAIEVASNVATRVERILWLGFHTASAEDNTYLYFDEDVQRFTTEEPSQGCG